MATIFAAIKSDNINKVQKFIVSGVNVNKKDYLGITPLYRACLKGNLAIVKLLIEANADVNMTDKEGRTPLFIACHNKYLAVAKLLIEANADINKANNTGITPLFGACEYGNLEIVKLLIEANADVNKANNNGNTPLYVACYNGHLAVVKLLIEANADITKANNIGNTPLYGASYYGYSEIVELLIEANADVNKANNIGKTSLFVACQYGNLEIVKLLIENGANVTNKIIQNAKNNEYINTINNYILNKVGIKYNVNSPKWKGMSRSDIEKFDAIFESEENMRNFSCCPICLQFTERSEACNYMTHNCSKHEYFHEELYYKYTNRGGNISWCSICGRICIGHNHYVLGHHTALKPEVIVGGDPFEKDCRVSSGGGGLPEKVTRLRRLREKALELQAQVGKMDHEAAMDQLVEAMWDAPLAANNKANNILRSKKWNISSANFPANVIANNKPLANVNDPSKYAEPKVYVPGNANYAANYITYNNVSPVIVFNHKGANGSDYIHKPIAKDTLLMFLTSLGEKQGKCFDNECGGLLWPKEIELAFADPKMADTVTDEDKAALNAYKERFNRWHSQSGGLRLRSSSMKRLRKTKRLALGGALFTEATNAQCVLPRSKGGLRLRLRSSSSKKRQTRRVRR